jgi:hypothetical protein
VTQPAVSPRRNVYNPDEAAPTIYYVAAGSARDLDVAGSKRNADALFKVEALLCPVFEISPGEFEAICCTDPTGQDETCRIGDGGPCDPFGGDTDADGVCDNGDGTPDYVPCPTGVTTSCDDNCVKVANGNQEDSDQNGIGDACQCGDVNGDGVTNVTDALLIAKGQVGSADPNFGKCDVNGDTFCNVTDALTIAKGQVGSAPEAQKCPTYLGL